jgi:hypothetical protein
VREKERGGREGGEHVCVNIIGDTLKCFERLSAFWQAVFCNTGKLEALLFMEPAYSSYDPSILHYFKQTAIMVFRMSVIINTDLLRVVLVEEFVGSTNCWT